MANRAGVDLAAVRRSALNRDIRQRHQESPHRKRRIHELVKGLKHELQEKAHQRADTHGSPNKFMAKQLKEELKEKAKSIKTTNKVERLGSENLKSIESHKSFFAEIRPQRRRIKFAARISNWDRSQEQKWKSNARVGELDLNDLQIHGKPALQQETDKEEEGEVFDPKEANEYLIKQLETNIRKTFRTLKRLNKEMEKDKQSAEGLYVMNQSLRKDLIAMPTPKLQSMRQSQKQLASTTERLKEKIAELDEQNAILNMQKQQIRADIMALNTEIKKERKSSLNFSKHSVDSEAIPLDEASGVLSHLSSHSNDTLPVLPDIQSFPLYGVSSDQGMVSTHSTRSIPMPSDENGPVLNRVTTTPAAA